MLELGLNWRFLEFAFFAKSSAKPVKRSMLYIFTVAPKWSRTAKSLAVSGQPQGSDRLSPGKGR